jgi:uncharacterized protein (DUF433 family)
MTKTDYQHIEMRNGVPYLEGTQTKVIEVALDRLAHHWDGDEIHRQHPHLSLGQIYSALAYYYDHQDEIDRVIADQLRFVQQLKENQGESPIRLKLKAMGLIP